MDCRVKPGNDKEEKASRIDARAAIRNTAFALS
jgi:hypothetical protein